MNKLIAMAMLLFPLVANAQDLSWKKNSWGGGRGNDNEKNAGGQ